MSKEVEEWRPIVGYEGLYEVSDWGRIRSVDRVIERRGGGMMFFKSKILKQSKDGDGYLQVYPSKNSKKKNLKTAVVVAKTFIPIPQELQHLIGTQNLQVNHKDEDKTNNFLDNLEWCDRPYNVNYGTRNERVAEKLRNRKDCSKTVYQYTLEGELVKIWDSASEAKRNGYSQGNIWCCCRGERKTHKGYKWSYEPL